MDAATRTTARGGGRSSSSKVFNCFRPTTTADDDFPEYTAALPPCGDDAALRRRKRLRRSFSAALKAVLFKSSLLKKSRSENAKDDYDGKRSTLFSRSKRFMSSTKNNNIPCKPSLAPEEVFRTSSDRSSIFTANSGSRAPSPTSSSPITSRSSSHSRAGSDKLGRSASGDHLRQQMSCHPKSVVKRRDNNNNNNNSSAILAIEMCVFVICLGGLVWGKAFAVVVCTAAWLFIAPASRRQQQQQRRLRRVDSFDGVDSEEYKKRVIMEGLLERSR